jgi:hypothetical protein
MSLSSPTPLLHRLWPAAVVAALFLVVVVPIILSGNTRGRGASDQINYHEPTIQIFAVQWPHADLSNYYSATTPGYHLLLALASRWTDGSARSLRLLGAVFSIGLLATLAAACAGRAPPAVAVACTLPLAASIYVVSAGAWLLPDNAAWWGVLGVLLLALRPRVDVLTVVGGGAVLLALVLVRQIHLWAAAALWMAAWIGPARGGQAGIGPVLFSDLGSRIRRVAPALLATIPAALAVGYFVWLWHGLIVPRYQGKYHGSNLATPAFVLAIIGAFSIFYGAYLVAPLRELWAHHRKAVLLVAGLGLLVCALPATTYSQPAGRYSGLWNVARKLPVLGGHSSPLIVGLGLMGAVALLAWFRAVPVRDRFILGAALAAFTAAQTLSPELWQRYHEPMILMVLALMAVRVAPAATLGLGAGHVLGPCALALTLGLVTALQLRGAQPAEFLPDGGGPPPWTTFSAPDAALRRTTPAAAILEPAPTGRPLGH